MGIELQAKTTKSYIHKMRYKHICLLAHTLKHTHKRTVLAALPRLLCPYGIIINNTFLLANKQIDESNSIREMAKKEQQQQQDQLRKEKYFGSVAVDAFVMCIGSTLGVHPYSHTHIHAHRRTQQQRQRPKRK